MGALTLRLSPGLDAEAFAEAYRRRRFVQVPGIFPTEVAEQLHMVLARHTPWRFVFAGQGADRGVVLSKAQYEAMSPAERTRVQQQIMQRATANIGYAYNGYPMIQALLEGWDPGHPLHQVTEFLQTPEFREFGRRIIGAPKVTKVDAQATLYQPGHFLTRHQDIGEKQERRAAYTLGFSKGWQPDWGGLLAFLDDNLDIESAYIPRFNTLTLFDGLRPHSVTAVSPFAGAGRYSIVGWLRDDPAPRSQA